MDDVIDNDKRPPLPENTPPRLAKLIQECWDGNPKKRPYFSEILNELDEILVEILIKEETARDVWRSLKSKVRTHTMQLEPLLVSIIPILHQLKKKKKKIEQLLLPGIKDHDWW